MRSVATFGWLPWAVLGLLLFGSAILLSLGPQLGLAGEIELSDLPEVLVPIGSRREEGVGSGSGEGAGPPLPEGAAMAGGPPVDVREDLLAPGPYGAVPAIGADGTTSFGVYRSHAAVRSDRPAIALIVLDLGLDPEAMDLAVRLPPAFALAFTPYGRDLAGWMRYARSRGHEVILELPVRSPSYPREDAGPLALHPGLAPESIADRLDRLLASGKGYFALLMEAGTFTLDPAGLKPLVAALAETGTAVIELGDGRLRPFVRDAGIPYLSARPPIDEDPAPGAIDLALGSLEAEALRTGVAVGSFHGYPITYARLGQWFPTLEAKGLEMVPVSAAFDRMAQEHEGE